ncbi:hypothetical protein CKO15_08925 [Halorhodospira abdelmalekii]|uniref:ATP-binding protein n=1 Tax=Halorhodospira abdelmalekii TaxID=421629 RepID=UPI001904450D|nr:ATP-binding protein [Halorhodospira abdelmalekii]MBK1735404.1 hypothetical protein [Halorhodospira abdelmalekii]
MPTDNRAIISSNRDFRLLAEIPATRESSRVLLRARVLATAERVGFSAGRRQDIALVASELVTNIRKHADGHGVVQVWLQPGPTIDLVAIDHGPGILRLEEALQDGYSTTRTLGKGLGSIVRLSDHSDFYTHPARRGHCSSAILARFVLRDAPGQAAQLGLFARSHRDGRYNGDALFLYHNGLHLHWLHADGLGSGERAAASSAPLGEAVLQSTRPEEVLHRAQRRLTPGHGVVALAGRCRLDGGRLEVAGIGDMHLHVLRWDESGAALKEVFSFVPGTLGYTPGSAGGGSGLLIRSHSPVLGERAIVLSASDGIRRNWTAQHFESLFARTPQLIAYVLGYEIGRFADDQSLAVFDCGGLRGQPPVAEPSLERRI